MNVVVGASRQDLHDNIIRLWAQNSAAPCTSRNNKSSLLLIREEIIDAEKLGMSCSTQVLYCTVLYYTSTVLRPVVFLPHFASATTTPPIRFSECKRKINDCSTWEPSFTRLERSDALASPVRAVADTC